MPDLAIVPCGAVAVARQFADITKDGWASVAERVRVEQADGWLWHLDSDDCDRLEDAREAGSVLTAQRRDADGVTWLVARRAKKG